MTHGIIPNREKSHPEENMKTKRHTQKLTNAEAQRLEQFINKNGGQIKVGETFGVTPATLSRNINQHTAPSPMLRKALVGVGIIKQ